MANSINELKFDDQNFNKHTEYGMSLLEDSLRELGAGRSVLIDKDNNIIAGNGVIEAAGQIGLDKIKVIETTGDEIVAVKRTDVSLNSYKGRKLAMADNATAQADLSWDFEKLGEAFEDDELKKWVKGAIASASDLELNQFFEESDDNQQKEPKLIKCPFCGKEFEK